MDFWSWHYSFGVKFYIYQYGSMLRGVVQYFALPLLFRSFFAPWKRLTLKEKGRGFDLAEYLNTISFNFISRLVGACARFVLIISAVFSWILVALAGLVGLGVWYIFPFLSKPVFERYKKNPFVFTRNLLEIIKKDPAEGMQYLMSSDAGKFLQLRLGVSAQELLSAADLARVKIDSVNSFKGLESVIHHFVESSVWGEDFYISHHLTPQDFVHTAGWWDKRASSESHINFDNLEVKAGIGRELLVGYTPTLDEYGEDLGYQEKPYHLFGRNEIINRIERALTGGMSVILTGRPGVGKSAVLLEFAHQARYGKLGQQMAFKRVVSVDLNLIAADSGDINVKRRLISNLLSEASSAGNIILALKDIHKFTNQDVEGVDFTETFEHFLEKSDLKVVVVSTDLEYERFISRNIRLRKFFETIEVYEPEKEEAMLILLEAADSLEKEQNVVITTSALRRIINASAQYITDIPFPEKAIDLLHAVIVYHKQRGPKNPITFQEAEIVISERTGVPVSSLTEDRKKQLTELEKIMHQRLVEQDEAISLIAKTLRSKSAGVVSSNRPIGSFLLLGPTGVGKTETAKVLARVYFGSEDLIKRFDMAEFAGKDGIERLIGSQSNNQPGLLTTAIKNNPASLLLLDEFEKAPSTVYNLFLRLLDEGKISDAFGNEINCANLFVIATSNAGASYIRDLVQEGQSELQSKVTDYVMKNGVFSPEFLNRFDGVVVYKPLSKSAIRKIAEILLMELAENVHQSKNIAIRFSNEAVGKIVQEGFQPEFGARPMRRLIDLQLGDLIGTAVLKGEVNSGDRASIVLSEDKKDFVLVKDM